MPVELLELQHPHGPALELQILGQVVDLGLFFYFRRADSDRFAIEIAGAVYLETEIDTLSVDSVADLENMREKGFLKEFNLP